jgi:alkylation response protein AidB-like acyl-CoA dehydrogenase
VTVSPREMLETPQIPQATLDAIAAGARERDEQPNPVFPGEAFDLLEREGALAWNAVEGSERPPALDELTLVRRVARADSSVGRIFDGHVNAVERLAVQAPDDVRAAEFAAVRAGRLRAGVWGGDPVPGEGPPAAVVQSADGEVLRGVKTFCSGAGGLHRALVLARDPEGGPPLAVWIDLTDQRRIEIDETWYRSRGLRASVSHRVVFHDAPIIARFGGPGALAEQPWFARDAIRTAASWAGMADTATESALDTLAERPEPSPLEGLAAGRIMTSRRAIDIWLQAAARAMDAATGIDVSDESTADLAAISVQARVAITAECTTLLDSAARACGSRPFARGDALDRARRDLEVFLLQHRLDPILARLGAAELTERSG